MKKILILGFTVLFAVLLFAGINSSVGKNSEAREIARELDALTDDAIANIGSAPTLEGIAAAQRIVNEKIMSVREKVKTMRDAEKMPKGSETEAVIAIALENNQDKIVAVYDKQVAKSYEDLRSLNKSKAKLIRLNSKGSSKEFQDTEKEIGAQADVVQENVDLVNALDALMENYKPVQEKTKQKGEQL